MAMIAIPLDDKHATTISFEYEKAPFFALLDTMTGHYQVIENTRKNTMIIDLLHENGADTTVCHSIDDALSVSCMEQGVSVYEVAGAQATLDEIYEDAHEKRGLFA